MKSHFMPIPHCYVFGWCYGRLAALAPKLATPGRYSNALNLPFTGWGELNNAVMASVSVPGELFDEMASALAGIPADNLQANMEGQTAFAMGYYNGVAGNPCLAPFDISAARKERGMTQQQLADALGVAQARVAEWEAGRKTPRPSTLEKIKNVLRK